MDNLREEAKRNEEIRKKILEDSEREKASNRLSENFAAAFNKPQAPQLLEEVIELRKEIKELRKELKDLFSKLDK